MFKGKFGVIIYIIFFCNIFTYYILCITIVIFLPVLFLNNSSSLIRSVIRHTQYCMQISYTKNIIMRSISLLSSSFIIQSKRVWSKYRYEIWSWAYRHHGWQNLILFSLPLVLIGWGFFLETKKSEFTD